MEIGKKTAFNLSPYSTAHEDSDKTETCVAYKPNYKHNAYIEDERGWFLEQGAKCTIQKTPKNSVATYGHLHDALEIIYIKEGSFTAYINDRRYDAEVGDMLFFYSADVHRVYSCAEDENSYYVIKIHPSLVFDVSDKKNGAGYMLRFTLGKENAKRMWKKSELVGTHVEKTILSLSEECRERRPFFDIAVKKYAAELLLFVLRCEQRVATDGGKNEKSGEDGYILELIYKAITYIKRNYQNDLSALDVATAIGMSYGHFSRSFGKITGQSFKEYLNAVRTKRAEELLSTSDESVEEISEKCGYSGVSYFIMVFKKCKGITPHAYRKKFKA